MSSGSGKLVPNAQLSILYSFYCVYTYSVHFLCVACAVVCFDVDQRAFLVQAENFQILILNFQITSSMCQVSSFVCQVQLSCFLWTRLRSEKHASPSFSLLLPSDPIAFQHRLTLGIA